MKIKENQMNAIDQEMKAKYQTHRVQTKLNKDCEELQNEKSLKQIIPQKMVKKRTDIAG